MSSEGEGVLERSAVHAEVAALMEGTSHVSLEPRTVDMVHLRAGATSMVLQTPNGQAPEVLYWGADLGDLTPGQAHALSCAAEEPYDGNAPNHPLEVGVIPLSSTGWMGRPGLVGHRADGSSWAPHLHATSLDIDLDDLRILGDDLAPSSMSAGATVDPRGDGRPTVGADSPHTRNRGADSPDPVARGRLAQGGSGRVTYTLQDHDAGLALALTVEMLPQGLLRARAAITNTADVDYQLDELSLAFPLPLSAAEILDFSGRWGREREPLRLPVELGCHLHEGRHGRTGFDAPMMMYCGEPGFDFAAGEVWGLHVAHSGNHRTWVERLNNGRQVIGGGELLLPGEISLAPEGTYTSPWIYLQHADGLDPAAQRLHRWERTLPTHPTTDRPVTLNVWEAVYFNHDLDTLKRLAERAARIGVERYVVDDGWFLHRRDDTAGLGDWEVDPDVWPHGLHPLIDHVRSLGMQFGLWVEPEMINPDSDLARAHPEWIMRAGADLPLEWRNQQVLDLAIPEAWQHVHDKISALLDEYDISYFKWDHNRDLIDAGNALEGGRAVVHEQTLACYRLMDALRAEHPGLEIESCSSGGGRIDLEMITHVQRFWLSDCIDPHERQGMMRWSEQLVAPEYMGTHVASERSHTTGRVSDLNFRLGTARWGHLGFEWDLLPLSEKELDDIAEWIAFYKENRDLLLDGDLQRRDIADGSIWLHGVVAPDRSRGLYQLVCLERSPLSPRGMFTLPGLDPDATYRVRPRLVGGGPSGLILPPWGGKNGEGISLTGRALAHGGLHTPLLYPDQVLIIDATQTRN